MVNKVIQGDSLEVLKTLPDSSIDCCISSPPYYGLRDYGVSGQLGLEKTFHEYLNKLIEIYAEVKRVLKPSGTIWVNLGDSYSGSSNGKGDTTTTNRNKPESYKEMYKGQNPGKQLIDKSLLNIPSRFAIKMTDELNLIQRNEIIWYKRNCMPSSARDRFTVDFEKIYFFTKSKKYYFEQITEPSTDPESYSGRKPRNAGTMFNVDKKNYASAGNINENGKFKNEGKTYPDRNKRCVWDVTTKPYKEAHFAVYPEDLVRPMIQAGCPEFICTKCGKVREKVVESSGTPKDDNRNKIQAGNHYRVCSGKDLAIYKQNNPDKVTYSQCNCNAPFTGGIVLDIFAGSGTTLKVAKEMGRNYLGIELNPEYIPLIEKRLNSIPLKLAI